MFSLRLISDKCLRWHFFVKVPKGTLVITAGGKASTLMYGDVGILLRAVVNAQLILDSKCRLRRCPISTHNAT